jgi:hypothetical protein
MIVFWDVVPHSLLNIDRGHHPDGVGSKHLWKAREFLQDYRA